MTDIYKEFICTNTDRGMQSYILTITFPGEQHIFKLDMLLAHSPQYYTSRMAEKEQNIILYQNKPLVTSDDL